MANGRTQGKKRAAHGHKANSSTSKSLKFTIPARPQADTTKPEVTPSPKSADTPALDLEVLESYNWNFSDLPDNNIPRLDNETLTNAEEDTEIIEVMSLHQVQEVQKPASESPAPVSEPNVDSTSESEIVITPPPVAKRSRKAKPPAEVDEHAILQAQSTSKVVPPCFP